MKFHPVTDVCSKVVRKVGVCNCSMFCCTLLYVHSSFDIILMGKRELVALLSCLLVVVWLFAASWVCLQFVIVVFPDHTHLLFLFLMIHCLFLLSLFVFFSVYNAVLSVLSSCPLILHSLATSALPLVSVQYLSLDPF